MDNASDKLIGRILDKQDEIAKDLAQINVTLAKQEVSLAEHIRRTELLELEVKPIKQHVQRVNNILAAMGLIVSGISILAGLVKVAEFVIEKLSN